MKKRIRNLLALLLCFALVTAESSFAFAGKTGKAADIEASPEEDIRILGAGKGQIGDYTIEGNLEYGKTGVDFTGRDAGTWTVTDRYGNEIYEYRLEIRSLSFNGKEYSYRSSERHYINGQEAYIERERDAADLYKAYRDGLKTGDKVDLRVGLSIGNNDNWLFGPPILTTTAVNPTGPVFTEGVIKDVEIVKNRITADNLNFQSYTLYRGNNLDKHLKENHISTFGVGVANAFIRLTEAGLKKVGDFSKDRYVLTYGEDFTLSFEYQDYPQGGKYPVYIDVTDNYEVDLEGYKMTLEVRNSYRMSVDVREIQAGTTADGLRDILKKHLILYKNEVKVTPDASKLEINSIRISDRLSANQIPVDDDDAITEALSETGRYITIELSLETGSKDGEPEYTTGSTYLKTMKNAYNLYLEPFEEVAHTTGASYERTAHDFMVNLYALKNDSEKIRVEDKNGRFLLTVYDEEKDDDVYGSESDAIFSKIRGGDSLDCYIRWFIPIEDEDREDDSDRTFSYEGDLKFFAYDASKDDDASKDNDASKDIADPYSEAHNTNGQDITELPQGAPAYVFDEVKSNTLVGGVKVNIAKKFESYVSLNGFDANAKKRYKVSDKKIAKIDKKGNIIPKKSGKITVTLEQKVKGSGWTQVGDPIELFIQVPEMKKEAEGAAGQTLDAKTFLGKTSYAPTSWKSSKPAVAEVDEKTGIVTMKKKGKAKIFAIYGEGKNSSKKKYKTKLRVNG